MPHRRMFGSNQAYTHYVQTISSAYNRFINLIDPDYAHQNDEEAWEKIQRDAVLVHLISRRCQAVAGLDWKMQPASSREVDKRAAQIVEDLIRPSQGFTQMRARLAKAIFRGSGWEKANGERGPFQVTDDEEIRNWWRPTSFENVDRWRFQIRRVDKPEEKQIRTQWEMASVDRGVYEPLLYPEQFIHWTFENEESTLGYGRGLLQAMYFFWRSKEICLANGLNAVERWSQGLVDVSVNGLREGDEERTNDEIVDDWIDVVVRMRAENVIVHDAEDKFEIKDAPTNGPNLALEYMNYFDRTLSQLVLTSVLPTGGGADIGSLARSQVEKKEMESTFQADRVSQSEAITSSLVAMVWDRNLNLIREVLDAEGFTDQARMPTYQTLQAELIDRLEEANIAATALGAGIDLPKKEVYDKIGYTAPKEGEDVVKGQTAAAGPPGLPGFSLSSDDVTRLYKAVHEDDPDEAVRILKRRSIRKPTIVRWSKDQSNGDQDADGRTARAV